MRGQIVKCVNEDCENEFRLGMKGKLGLYRECPSCGREIEKSRGNVRIGGIMEYAHKTAPVIKLMSLEDAKEINRRTKRPSGTSIISGMSEVR